MATSRWKRGRGRLGVLAPLLGEWVAEADGPMGRVRCTRRFAPALGGAYVELVAHWSFGKPAPAAASAGGGTSGSDAGGGYREHAFFGAVEGPGVGFWSFTSDGKRSTGELADVSELHPQAIGFVAHMPAGVARQAYWPADDGGVVWVVDAQTKKGWSRMVEHHYARVAAGDAQGGGDGG